jgi:hypothetical protein
MGPIQDWVRKLIAPDTDLPLPPSSTSSGFAVPPGPNLGNPITTPLYQQQWAQQPLGSGTPPGYPPVPGGSPPTSYTQPPPPGTAPPPLPSAAQPMSSVNSVALFNQIASQQGYNVSYEPSSVGPSHQPRWTVKIIGKLCFFS